MSSETNPLTFANVRTIGNPFPPIQQVKPRTTAELNAANPRVLGHDFENVTSYAEQWHFGVERHWGAILRERLREAPPARAAPGSAAAGGPP